MKISVILASVTCLFYSFTASAIDEGKVTFGLEVAPAVTWLGMNDHPEVECDGAKMKFNGGIVVYFNYGDENKYSVFTGLNYNSYGGFLKGDLVKAAKDGRTVSSVYASPAGINSRYERVKYNFGEFEIPVGVRFRTGDINNWRFAAFLNLGLGITVHGNASMKDYNSAIYQLDNYTRKNFNYSPMRFRGTYGIALGAEYDLEAVVLTGKVRYKGSMTNMYFYKDDMFNPSASLNLNANYDRHYSENVCFMPHTLELAVGVLF